MGTAATKGEAVVSGKAGAEGDSEGDDVRNERGDAAVFNGEGQYGEMDGSGNCADEEEESSLLGGVGRHGIRVLLVGIPGEDVRGDCLPFILRGIVGWVKGCLQFRPPSSAGRNPQRAGSVRRVCGGVADTHAGI